jgi:hypothetical protein
MRSTAGNACARFRPRQSCRGISTVAESGRLSPFHALCGITRNVPLSSARRSLHFLAVALACRRFISCPFTQPSRTRQRSVGDTIAWKFNEPSACPRFFRLSTGFWESLYGCSALSVTGSADHVAGLVIGDALQIFVVHNYVHSISFRASIISWAKMD